MARSRCGCSKNRKAQRIAHKAMKNRDWLIPAYGVSWKERVFYVEVYSNDGKMKKMFTR